MVMARDQRDLFAKITSLSQYWLFDAIAGLRKNHHAWRQRRWLFDQTIKPIWIDGGLDAVMRRTHDHCSATISVGDLVVDLNRSYAKVSETWLELTAKEFRIIEFLALQKGAVFSKNAFLGHLYGGIGQPEPEIINAFTCKLRQKFIKNGAECLRVDSIWRKGCILRSTSDYQVPEKTDLPSPLVC